MELVLGFKKDIDPATQWYWKRAAKIIQVGTKSKYFHVEIAIDDKWVAAHTEKGIEIHPYVQHYFDPLYDYFTFSTEDLTQKQQTKFWAWINGEVGTGYDWKGIYLTQVLNMDWESKDKWFCSEIVAKILQMLFVPEFIDVKPNRLAPKDIYDLLKDKLVQKLPPKNG